MIELHLTRGDNQEGSARRSPCWIQSAAMPGMSESWMSKARLPISGSMSAMRT